MLKPWLVLRLASIQDADSVGRASGGVGVMRLNPRLIASNPPGSRGHALFRLSAIQEGCQPLAGGRANAIPPDLFPHKHDPGRGRRRPFTIWTQHCTAIAFEPSGFRGACSLPVFQPSRWDASH